MSIRQRIWTTNGVEHEAWQVSYMDGQGERQRKQFKLKKDAEAFLARAKTEVMDGTHIAAGDGITVEQAEKLWITAKQRAGREQATVDQYKQHVELHIAPFVGKVKLTELSPVRLSKFEDDLIEAGRSSAMVKKVMVSLGSLIANAQKRGHVHRNVVRDMRGLNGGSDARAEKRAKGRLRVGVDIPSPEEIKSVLGVLAGRWRPLLMTAIFTGMCASELRGLRWEDVDFAKMLIRVRQRADRYNAIGRPKSEAGDRDVPIPGPLVNVLREWRLVCPKKDTGKRDAEGQPVKALELVFPNGQGKVESLGNIINRGLTPAQLNAGITMETGKVDGDGKSIVGPKYGGMHALRHFNASWLINPTTAGGLGLSPKEVQERLGHSSIVITMNTYAHLFPKHDAGDEMSAAAAALLG